jgi:hypothetical protein
MKMWSIAIIGLSCLTLTGCRTDPAIQLLERENRQLEDEIYRLRGCLDDFESGTVTTSVVSEAKTSSRRHRDDDSASSSDSGLPPGATTAPPKVEIETTPENEVPEIRHSPKPNKTPSTRNAPKNAPRLMPAVEPAGPVLNEASETDPASLNVPISEGTYVPSPKGDSRKVVQIVLHDDLCRANDRDGLRVVIEPRDRSDRRVDAPGEVSVVLIDPALVPQGSKVCPPESRIARWTFPADAVASMFRNIGGANVIYIESPWPDKAPEQRKLRLFVRYTTRDGRKLETPGLPIDIVHAADRTTRTKRPERDLSSNGEEAGPALLRDEPSRDVPQRDEAPQSEYADASPERHREPVRTATRENAPGLKRPVWSPERR